MVKLRSLFVLATILISISVVADELPQIDPIGELFANGKLLSESPNKLFRAVIDAKRLEFLGVAGFSVVTPGIDNRWCLAKARFVRVIPGTSDVLNEDQAIVQKQFEAYARRYNQRVRRYLVREGVFAAFIVCE